MSSEMVPAPKPQVAVTERGVVIRSVDELYRFGEMVQRSGLAPRGFQRAEQVCVAVAHGMELGLSPMQSLQGLVVINGKVSMYGDTARALVQAHPDCYWIKDNLAELSALPQPWPDDVAAVVKIRRRMIQGTGTRDAIVRSFSVAQAKAAGLWGKEGPWRQYPDRMLYYRALGFALRDAFPDVLRGIKTAEELRDYPANGPQSGSTLPPKDLDEVTELLESGSVSGVRRPAEKAAERGRQAIERTVDSFGPTEAEKLLAQNAQMKQDLAEEAVVHESYRRGAPGASEQEESNGDK